MAYNGFVVKIENLRKHSNADRLQIAEIFHNNVIVGMDTHVGDIGVFFPVDGQLSERFCTVNDLVRRKDENGNQCGGYLDPDKRNIKAIKLRGERSEGLYLPITCLADFCAVSSLKVGDTISIVNGEEICCKYIPSYSKGVHHSGDKIRKVKINFAPTFYEHVDTEHLAYNLNKFKCGDIVQLTLKMHGTSGRTGYLPLIKFKKQNFFEKLFHMRPKQYSEYGYVTGTRRVVLDDSHDGGFYKDNSFRKAMAAKFEGKLHKGEVVYYEIVGFQGPGGAPIMSQVANSKVKDPEFTKLYGETTTFSYGCDPKGTYEGNNVIAYWDEKKTDPAMIDTARCCDVYVYRMTMVNEDGDVVEYNPDQIKERCEQMGVNYVHEFCRFMIPDYTHLPDDVGSPTEVNAGEYVLRAVEEFFDGPDPIGKTHIREGVVARILNRSNFAVYKHKNFNFKVLEGIAKDSLTQEQVDSIDADVLSEM